MEANQDREWHVSPSLYPVERDSRVTVPNPEFHPSVYFVGGKFYRDQAGTQPYALKDVPAHIRQEVKTDLPPPRVMKPIVITADPAVYDRNGGRVGPDSLLAQLAAANAEHDKPEPKVAPKRGRGRPKGSKNKTKATGKVAS